MPTPLAPMDIGSKPDMYATSADTIIPVKTTKMRQTLACIASVG